MPDKAVIKNWLLKSKEALEEAKEIYEKNSNNGFW